MNDLFLRLRGLRPLFLAPSDGGGAPPADGTTTPPADGGGDTPAPWYASFDPADQDWVKAKGLDKGDVAELLPKVAKGYRNAEKLIGKGTDAILERPAQGQSVSEWLKANGGAFGLPEAEDGYAVTKPDDWPADLPWMDDLEAKARKMAFEMGVPPDLHKAYVAFQAKEALALYQAAEEGLVKAKTEMMAELQKDWGNATDANLTVAKQGAAWLAQQAGLSEDSMGAVMQLLTEKTGDANVARAMHAIGAALGEDSIVSLGKGGAGKMTADEARTELKAMMSPDSEYAKAVAANDRIKLRDLTPRREMLTRIANGG